MRSGIAVLVFAAGLLLTNVWADDKPAAEKVGEKSQPVPAVEPKQKAPTSEYEIRGKILGISIRGTDFGSYMQGAKIRKLGNREFLVGEWPPFPDQNAYHGMVTWVPLDDIVHVMEFESLEKAMQSYADHGTDGERTPGSSFSSPSLKTR
jgi:hypothetical protein